MESFFYPLDCLKGWNKLYGKNGFYQYQCVIPSVGDNSRNACKALLQAIAKSKQGSFLAVLKTFGKIAGKGYMSFPTEGFTLALDFSNRGEETTKLFDALDKIVNEAGGRLYPAKDARMSGKNFRHYYPNWEKVEKLRDPAISSSFWRRVTND